MSIPKKGFRKIVVGDVEYILAVRNNGDYKGLFVERGNEGQLLTVGVQWDIAEIDKVKITLSLVKEIITDALKQGWRPDEKNIPKFVYKNISIRFFKGR